MTLQEIVEQLRSCGYKCEAGPIEMNTAFMELEELAEKEDEPRKIRESLIQFCNDVAMASFKTVYAEFKLIPKPISNDTIIPRLRDGMTKMEQFRIELRSISYCELKKDQFFQCKTIGDVVELLATKVVPNQK